MPGCSMRAHPSLPVCIIARIDSSVSRLLVTFGDNFWMRLRRAGYTLLSFYDSLHYSTYCLGRLATLCDIMRQLFGGLDSCRAGYPKDEKEGLKKNLVKMVKNVRERRGADVFLFACGMALCDGPGKRMSCLWLVFFDDGLHHALSSFFDSLQYIRY